MNKLFMGGLALVVVIGTLSGCSSTMTAKNFNGLTSPDGNPNAHISTSNVALHLGFGKIPVVGDATLEQTVNDFTTQAKATGASKVRIVQSDVTRWWLIFPPISFIITPVTSNVAGDAIQ